MEDSSNNNKKEEQNNNEIKNSANETSDVNKQNNKPLSPMPQIENYIHPLSIITLNIIQPKFEAILNLMKKKLEDSKPVYYIKKEEVKIIDQLLVNLFQIESELKDGKYDIIIDQSNFYHYGKTDEEIQKLKDVKKIDEEYLKKLYLSLNDKGVLMLMCDFQLLCQINNSLKNILGNENKTKHFIKLYILEKLPLVGLIYIQKMSLSNNIIDISDEKLLAYEVYEDYTVTKPISYKMSQLQKSVTYMYEMYNYQGYLSILHPGYIIPIKIKENFWSENIDYTLTICDAEDPNLLETKKCVAIIVSKNYANDFIYINPEGNMALCRQVNAARILLIRPAPFNFDDTTTIKNKMSSYILLFKFKDCVTDSIPVMLMSDENNETNRIFTNDSLMVIDVVDNERKDILRQLIFLQSPNEIQSEIKISLTSKTNIKNDHEKKYHPIFTSEKYNNKNLVECLDENYLSMFYIKSILSSILFMNLENFPENKINVLVLGAGIGTINFYFDKILKSNVNVDAVELNSKVTEIGKEYFGLNNYKYKKGNIKWFFEDAKKFLLNNNNKDYYDMIVMDINNTNHNEGISPPPIFFEKDIISKIFSLLKSQGLYVINVMARSFKNYCDSFKILDSIFPNIFLVDNNEDLNKIHFCFKSKNEINEYIKTYEKNIEKLKNKEIADIEVIKETHKNILKRVVDTENVKKRIEDYENKKNFNFN